MRSRPIAALAALLTTVLAGTGTSLVVAATGGDASHARRNPQVCLAEGEGLVPYRAAAEIEWTGNLSILRKGQYRFHFENGSLSIDGEEVSTEPIVLEAGQRKLSLLTRRPGGATRVFLDWEGPGFAREPVPGNLLSHEPAGGTGAIDGRALFEDLGCSNCHLSDSPSIQRRPGPVLTGLGGRRKRPWIRHWLDDPESFRSWSTMPQMLSESQRGDVAAFLASQGSDPVDEPRTRDSHVEFGRSTFQSLGCVACHGQDLPLVGLGSKYTAGRLQQYLLDPIRFSPDGRMPSFHLDESEALALAAHLMESRTEAMERPAEFGDSERGREVVRVAGCLDCHSLGAMESGRRYKPLAELDEETGCLADSVPDGVPRYRLAVKEQQALRDFVARFREAPDVVAAPTFDLPRRLAQLRCHACHEVDGERPAGSLAEFGPPLTGVGAKLRRPWLERVIGSETRVMEWLELRMPSFGSGHAVWLAEALAKSSGVDPNEEDHRAVSGDRMKGHDALGVDGARGGMGCIGCHGWEEHASLGENGPNLSGAGQRLRREWFERWMRSPPRILPGTSMPSYFLGAVTPASRAMIDNFWAALVHAEELPAPFGFQAPTAAPTSETRPVPDDGAIVIRWDMPDASPAAIAVGLPGGLSYCFDAGESKLLYAWQGGFVDMGRTLLTKKNRETNLTETAEIVGDIFFREQGYPLRVGDRDRIPQRRFRGYRLVNSIPEFHYVLDGVSVYERVEVGDGGLVRHFRIEGAGQPMWFVPSESETVSIGSTLEGLEIPAGAAASFRVSMRPEQQ